MSAIESNDKDINKGTYDEFLDFVDKNLVCKEDELFLSMPLKLDELSIMFELIIDSGSYKNIIGRDVVKILQLPMKKHLRPSSIECIKLAKKI